MAHSLDGVRLKLERANEHLESLDREAAAWLDANRYPIFHEQVGNEVLVRVRVPFEVPLRFSVMAGDVFHNLRSALDNLAWQLSKLDSKADPPRRVEFPIFKDRQEFLKTSRPGGLWRINTLSPDHQAVIQRLQPYHRRKKAYGDPLWVLHEFSNLDKHRVPSYALPVLNEITVQGVTSGIATSEPKLFPGPFVDGAVVARFFVLRSAPHNRRAIMGVDFDFQFGITFDESALFKNQKIPTLYEIRDAVAAIPPLFEGDF